jgi:hypothetical protein
MLRELSVAALVLVMLYDAVAVLCDAVGGTAAMLLLCCAVLSWYYVILSWCCEMLCWTYVMERISNGQGCHTAED